MAVWSSLASKYNQNVNCTKNLFHFLKNGLKGKGTNLVPVRHSHERIFPLRTSTFEYFTFKKLLSLYTMIGVLPIVLLASYVNIFIGPAELALIPEGYEPEPWEYHKHPISRFFAKHLVPSPQELHERSLHTVFVDYEKKRARQLEIKIKKLMAEREDYQSWYLPVSYVKYGRKALEGSAELTDKMDKPGRWLY